MPVGQPLSKSVQAQLKARAKLLSNQEGRSNADLGWMHSNSIWIKLSSSVNTITDQEKAELRSGAKPSSITGTSQFAKDNVLYSTGMHPDRTGDIPSGLNTDKNGIPSGLYNNWHSSTGIRPRPGITGMTVKSKNTYGTLREAEVQVKCYTVEELEALDTLYFRPGFSVLLEFGHTVSLMNDGTFLKSYKTIDNFFNTSGIKQESLLEAIRKLRKDTDHNYDALFGYVKNFSWSFNASDGSYDCTIAIITWGEVIEGLGANVDPATIIKAAEFIDIEEEEQSLIERKSPFHFMIAKLEQYEDETKFTVGDAAGEMDPPSPTAVSKLKGPGTTHYYFRAMSDLADTGIMIEDSVNIVWVPLKTIARIFNGFIVPKDLAKSKNLLLTFYEPSEHKNPLGIDTSYVTFPDHFSIDPVTCILPKKPTLTTNAVADLDDIHSEIASTIGSSEADNIYNIYVSTYYLRAVLDPIFDAADGDMSVIRIFKDLLAGINDALGGINELDLHYEEDENRYYIVDRKNFAGAPQTPVIDLHGLSSSVLDLQISSKISNEISSQIAIAAQGGGTKFKDDVSNILDWNPGVLDRVILSKKAEDKEEDKSQYINTEKEQFEKWRDSVEDIFGAFTDAGGMWSDQKYRKGDHDSLKSGHKTYCQRQMDEKYKKKKQPNPGVVPVELSFKMLGIGGLRVAESFQIAPGILPSKYDRYGYIITGLEHTIDKNRWITSVKTQFYVIKTQGSPTGFELGTASAKREKQPRKPKEGEDQQPDDPNVKQPEGIAGAAVSYDSIKKAVQAKGYTWLDKPFMLNLVGIRNLTGSSTKNGITSFAMTDTFNDLIIAAWKDDQGKTYAEKYNASTDPGKYYTQTELLDSNGVAILAEGQYKDCWVIGSHHSRSKAPHRALVQSGRVTVYRDSDRNSTYTLDPAKKFTGSFGINIHRGAGAGKSSTTIGQWSAGCQVFQNSNNQDRVMSLCDAQVKKAKHSKFTYTLLSTKDISL